MEPSDFEAARANPRDVTRFMDLAASIITGGDPSSFLYSVPRDGKFIEGPSARFAEVVAYAWGNCQAGATISEESAEFITAQGFFVDLERNTSISFPISRRITDKKGKRYSSDMVAITANAACSIALRNAILKGIPKAVWQGLYDVARNAAAKQGGKTLADRLTNAVKAFGELGVSADKLAAKLGIEDMRLANEEHLIALRGMFGALRDHETTLAELFPAEQLTPPSPGGSPVAAGTETEPGIAATDQGPPPVKRGRPKTKPEPTMYLTDAEAVDYMADLEGRLLAATCLADTDEIAAEHDGMFHARLPKKIADQCNDAIYKTREGFLRVEPNS